MEILLIILGFAVGIAASVAAYRHAKSKPTGKTAKLLGLITPPGGGGGPGEPKP